MINDEIRVCKAIEKRLLEQEVIPPRSHHSPVKSEEGLWEKRV
jgi:hypothetical protein